MPYSGRSGGSRQWSFVGVLVGFLCDFPTIGPLSGVRTQALLKFFLGIAPVLQPRNKKEIDRLIALTAKKYFIRIYQIAVVGNHLHLILKIQHKDHYKIFVLVLSSRIASHVMRDQSFKVFKRSVLNQEWGDPHPATTEPQGKEQQFWQFRPWTRILYWGRDFKNSCKYVTRNTLEALGFIKYRPRKDCYKKWNLESVKILPDNNLDNHEKFDPSLKKSH